MTYGQAQECLQSILCSQLKKYHFQDILTWFRHHYDLTNHGKRVKDVLWYSYMNYGHDWVKKSRRAYAGLIEAITNQRTILTGK
jgi:hypothetical protein